MSPYERLEIAGVAYLRAVALARENSTPATWRRALTASRNLGAAIRDRDRALRGPTASVRSPHGRSPAGDRPRPAAAPPPSARGPAAPAKGRGHVTGDELWRGLVAEWERARALMDESRRLVRMARALRGDVGRWFVPGPRAARS